MLLLMVGASTGSLPLAGGVAGPVGAQAVQGASWQIVAGPEGLSEPISVATDQQGSLYVGDRGNPEFATGTGRVQKFSASGELVGSWIHESDGFGLGDPNGLALDAQGNVWVADYHNGYDAIQEYDPSGRALQNIQQPATGIAIDRTGNIYVTDFYCTCLVKLAPNGTVVWSVGSRGTGPGQFANLQYPIGIAINAAGVIYVADPESNRIEEFSPLGSF